MVKRLVRRLVERRSIVGLLCCCSVLTGVLLAQPQQEYAIVGGTVFRDSGLALAEADVTLEPVQDPATVPAAKSKSKSKNRKLTAITSPRGEFTFRVPPVPMKYRVTVTAKGFRGAEKIVETGGGSERVDATFSLSPESKH